MTGFSAMIACEGHRVAMNLRAEDLWRQMIEFFTSLHEDGDWTEYLGVEEGE